MNLDDLYNSTTDPREKLLYLVLYLMGLASEAHERLDLIVRGGIEDAQTPQYFAGVAFGAETTGVELRDLLIELGWVERLPDGLLRVVTETGQEPGIGGGDGPI